MEKTPKTFQKQLILYNFLIIICIACAVSYYNYYSYKKDIIVSETQNSVNRISSLADRLSVAYDEMISILSNCSQRKNLFVSSTFFEYREGYDNAAAAVYASTALKDLCAISSYNKDIYKLSLYNSGFLLQAGSSNGSNEDPQYIMNAPWFTPLLTKVTAPYRLTLVDNPFPDGNSLTPKILPLVRPLNHGNGEGPQDAWVFLGLSPSLFSNALSTLPDNSIAYAVTADGDIVAEKNPGNYPVSLISQTLMSAEKPSGHLKMDFSGEDCIVTYNHDPISGILLLEIVPYSSMKADPHVFYSTALLIFLFCIVIGVSLSFLFSIKLGAPIKRLTLRLESISKGDFTRDPSIETDDEIGMIGRQINQMSGHISSLLESRIQSEKEKKDLEIKMLQAQINPHFLYNTLDSIKWIATMQKNTGIVQVVTALSSLLKNMAKGFNEKVTLRQELDFLENYITIEKIRYIELFDVETEVDDPKLYDAKIVKLTLQPIVENAIFNGIEPSGRFGIIKIHASVKDKVLTISVRDNGIGIAPENIEKLLTDTSRVTKSTMSGIGLPNVDRRLKLVYGEDYGITIESQLDQYTMVTIRLPLEF